MLDTHLPHLATLRLTSILRFWVLTIGFAVLAQTAYSQETNKEQSFSPTVYHKFGVIFKIDSYEFVEIPPDPRAKMPQAMSLISVKSVNGVKLKEPKLIWYGFSRAIEEEQERFDKLVKSQPAIFAYETILADGRPSAPLAVDKEMENWSELALPGFQLKNSLTIVDAKGLELNSVRRKIKKLSQQIQEKLERAQQEAKEKPSN